MHAFERGARHQGVRSRHFEQACGFDDQEWPEPLTTTEARIAHGLEKPRRTAQFAGGRRRGKEPVEERLGIGSDRIEARQKRAVFGIHRVIYLASLPKPSLPAGEPRAGEAGSYIRSYI